MDAIEIDEVIDQGIETTKELFDKMKLEDTCVMVEGDELHVVSHREGKVWLAKVFSLSLYPPNQYLPFN